MVKLVNFQINEFPSYRIIGKEIRADINAKDNPIPRFWQECFQDGVFSKLDELRECHIDSSYVGWMGEWGIDGDEFTYICGILMKPETSVPEGFVYRDVPFSTVAIGWIQGLENEVYPVSHTFTERAMNEQGYTFDENSVWCMELYNCPRFTTPMDNGEIILDYYIPCKKG